jgi:hypothetical protein
MDGLIFIFFWSYSWVLSGNGKYLPILGTFGIGAFLWILLCCFVGLFLFGILSYAC